MKGKGGFTLIELLVVIIILGILAAIAVPKYLVVTKKAKATEAIQQMGVFTQEIKAYYDLHSNAWPSDLTKIGYTNDNSIGSFTYNYTANNLTAKAGDGSNITLNIANNYWSGNNAGSPQGIL